MLRAKGLDKRRDGSVIWVAPQAELAKFEQEKEDAESRLADDSLGDAARQDAKRDLERADAFLAISREA